MSTFGPSKDQIEIVKKSIQDVFGSKTDLKVYLFGSRATGKNKRNSDIDLAFKSKDKDLNIKISKIKMKLGESSLTFKCDLVNWDEIVHEYLLAIKKQKKVFWTKVYVLIFSPWRICPLGYHWVKEHLKEGNSDLTNPHRRRNPSEKDILVKDEIQKISDRQFFKNPLVKAPTNDMGCKGREKKFDYLINGWCSYWNDILKPEVKLHPNHLKALIASESTFIINPDRNEKHTAIGISQLMPATIKYLSIKSNELKDNYIEITKEDALDPNINICAASRLLYKKYEIVSFRKKHKLSWLEVLESYEGIKTQKGKRVTALKVEYILNILNWFPMIILKFLILLSLISSASGQVEVRYFNPRFMWISVATKYVKAGMSHPKENLSICWIKVETKNESFDFITRRAVPIDECMHLVSETRKLLKKNNVVEIIGSGGSKTKRGDYFSMFEIIRAKSGCVGYFGDCENFEKLYEEWNDWKSKPIDRKLYP